MIDQSSEIEKNAVLEAKIGCQHLELLLNSLGNFFGHIFYKAKLFAESK